MRVTPGIVAGGHEKIATAHDGSKFGLAPADAARACHEARADPQLDWRGLHVHLGSQVDDPGVLEGVVRWFREFCDEHALEPRLIDVGGGLGIPYGYESAPDARALAAAVAAAALQQFPAARLLIEPGRSVAGPAGVTLYRVLTRKTAADGTRWVALDGGMADNVRPALYGARYTVAAAGRLDEARDERVALAGRHCESGDVLARDVDLPPLARRRPRRVRGDGRVRPVDGLDLQRDPAPGGRARRRRRGAPAHAPRDDRRAARARS